MHIGAKWRQWSPEEEAIARQLLVDRAPDQAFRDKLGRTKSAAISHFYSKGKPPRVRQSRDNGSAIRDGSAGAAAVHTRPTDEMLRDALKRATVERSVTAFVFGDPPPGYSALDKKHAPGNRP